MGRRNHQRRIQNLQPEDLTELSRGPRVPSTGTPIPQGPTRMAAQKDSQLQGAFSTRPGQSQAQIYPLHELRPIATRRLEWLGIHLHSHDTTKPDMVISSDAT